MSSTRGRVVGRLRPGVMVTAVGVVLLAGCGSGSGPQSPRYDGLTPEQMRAARCQPVTDPGFWACPDGRVYPQAGAFGPQGPPVTLPGGPSVAPTRGPSR